MVILSADSGPESSVTVGPGSPQARAAGGGLPDSDPGLPVTVGTVPCRLVASGHGTDSGPCRDSDRDTPRLSLRLRRDRRPWQAKSLPVSLIQIVIIESYSKKESRREKAKKIVLNAESGQAGRGRHSGQVQLALSHSGSLRWLRPSHGSTVPRPARRPPAARAGRPGGDSATARPLAEPSGRRGDGPNGDSGSRQARLQAQRPCVVTAHKEMMMK
jgi:hypothetical protein